MDGSGLEYFQDHFYAFERHDISSFHKQRKNPMTELSRLAREVYFESKLQHSSSEKLVLHFSDRSTGSCPVEADSVGLKFALSNLVSNAIKSSHESGNIFIELYSQGWKCVFDVVDYGAGFDPHTLKKLNQMIQAKIVDESDSTGLTRTSKWVRGAQGALTFESIRGQGTRLRMELPLAFQSVAP
jgi:signal transduction histidine kinase